MQFEKKIIFDMHLSVIHKEKVRVKKEPIPDQEVSNSNIVIMARLYFIDM